MTEVRLKSYRGKRQRGSIEGHRIFKRPGRKEGDGNSIPVDLYMQIETIADQYLEGGDRTGGEK